MQVQRKYYFLTIAETLNITRAAERLFISQPALTQYLNKLEDELGLRLVDRSYTPLRLTSAGQRYFDYLSRNKELDGQLQRELDLLRAEEAQPLRIGMPLQKSRDVTRSILPQFIKRYPDTDISIWEGTSSTVRQQIISGELEIGFGHTFSDDDEHCVVKLLNKEKIVIICSSRNPIVAGRRSSLEDTLQIQPEALNEQLFFQMSPEYFLYDVEMAELKKHGVFPTRRLVLSNLMSVIATVAESPYSGFAFMPDYLFNEEEAKANIPRLSFLRLGERDVDWYFAMIKKKGRQLSSDGKLFWKSVSALEE